MASLRGCVPVRGVKMPLPAMRWLNMAKVCVPLEPATKVSNNWMVVCPGPPVVWHSQTLRATSAEAVVGVLEDPESRILTWTRSLATVEPPSKPVRSEEHTSELQSRGHLVCRLLLEKKKKT